MPEEDQTAYETSQEYAARQERSPREAGGSPEAVPQEERRRRLPPIRWSGYEHQHEEKGSDWFWALGIIAVSAALISILFGNILFALLIVVAAVTLGMLATKPPEIAEFVLNERGLAINDQFYPYSVIDAFWIEETDEHATLLVDTQKFMAPHLVIPIEEVDPDAVRDRFEQFVPEVELREPIAHRLLELLGF